MLACGCTSSCAHICVKIVLVTVYVAEMGKTWSRSMAFFDRFEVESECVFC